MSLRPSSSLRTHKTILRDPNGEQMLANATQRSQGSHNLATAGNFGSTLRIHCRHHQVQLDQCFRFGEAIASKQNP
jgi:hypothetical protein